MLKETIMIYSLDKTQINNKEDSLIDTKMEDRAKEYAVSRHQLFRQTYDGSPYTKHLEMTRTVAQKYLHYINYQERDNVLAACWCHDLIEDTEITQNQLSDVLNYQIAEIVFSVTNEHASTKLDSIHKTFSKIGQSKLAVFLKLCDRIANTSNSKINATEKYNKYIFEFPVFRYYLQKDGIYFHNMWQELESLYY
jgi:(p)ppGpp synthase/HD superfamily hydrolase